MDSLSLTTSGRVDDGKSTLIGRLLVDSRALPEDLQGVAGAGALPLSWLTDGLKEERAQNITIDVAYRYFRTARRRFVIADAPGHFEFTRNMVTAASTCQLALLLVDARSGMTEQTCRHAFLASLLGLRSLVLCVNKMDLVGYEESVYEAICRDFVRFSARLDFAEIHAFPISALHGDNIAQRSAHMPWYEGPTLLYHLETTHVGAMTNLVDARFPVQSVRRAVDENAGRPFCQGRVASGIFRPGDDVVVLPSGFSTTVHGIQTMPLTLDRAVAGQSVSLVLEDDLTVERGDLIARANNRPIQGQDFDATICWLSATQSMQANRTYVLRHLSRAVDARVTSVYYTIDVQTLSRRPEVRTVAVNDIARISVHTAEPLCFDPYRRNRVTGSFIVVDPVSHQTVAAGMIR